MHVVSHKVERKAVRTAVGPVSAADQEREKRGMMGDEGGRQRSSADKGSQPLCHVGLKDPF